MTGDFFLTQWAFLAMRWLYDTLTNQSVVLTVVISTLVIRCATIFGDIKSRKSSAKMQLIQPELQKLQKKYQNDPARLNLEQQKLMKANNVSMLGGCLPMLLTLPLFFIFIAAFRQWGNEMMVKLIVMMDADPEAGLEMFKSFRFLWVNNMWAADNGFKPVIMEAAEFFSPAMRTLPKLMYFSEHPEAAQLFERLGFFVKDSDGVYQIAKVTDALTAEYNALLAPCAELYAGKNNGWFLFPLIAGGTTLLNSIVMQKGQPKSANPNDTANSTNKIMKWMMPAMSFYFCLTMNATFALYWTISNVFSMISTALINKKFAKEQAEVVVEGVQQ